ncbi:MAG: signal peptidase I [Elusimicrobia bacterium]|nr:MAG: signal peptidase I [Elusimicrobiota bacterium]
MEARLFWIGIAMFAYAWFTKRWTASGRLDDKLRASLWHALFLGLAGFSVTLIAVLSVESRLKFVGASAGSLSWREVVAGFVGGSLLGAFGLWRAYSSAEGAEKRRHFLNEDLEWAETVYSAVILASLLMYFLVQAFKIPSGSMESTLRIGDHLFVNKFVYGVRIPFTDKRVLRMKPVAAGDIVVFRFPTDDPESQHCGGTQFGKDFIKRVVAVSGDTLEIKNGVLVRNGTALGKEPFTQFVDSFRGDAPALAPPPALYQELWAGGALDTKLGDSMKDHFGPVKVPAGSYFMMGDNRDRSCDSRFWGPVHEKYVKGKAWVIYWPPNRMGAI